MSQPNGELTMKTPTTKTAERPKATDVLVSLTTMAADFRFGDKPAKLSDLARIVSVASRLLRFSDLDERITVENAALMAVAKARQLIN